MKLETFVELVNLAKKMDAELTKFNKSLTTVLGSDSSSMYLEPLDITNESLVNILINEFGETHDGAEWFVYEGLPQIEEYGSTHIEDNGISYNIHSIEDYYEYLIKRN